VVFSADLRQYLEDFQLNAASIPNWSLRMVLKEIHSKGSAVQLPEGYPGSADNARKHSNAHNVLVDIERRSIVDHRHR